MSDPRRAGALYLSWMLGTAGVLVVLLADVLPVPLPFARPENLLVCFTESELFFMVFLWPFLPGREPERPGAFAVPLAAMLAFSLPLTAVSAGMSDASLAAAAGSVALVGAVAAFGAALRARAPGSGPVHLLAAFSIGAVLPFIAFLLAGARQGKELGRELPFLPYINPFWGAHSLGGAPAWIQTALFALLAAAILAAGRLKLPSSAPAR